MTNPTSNFGWQMPTPTDLVTDLPADFEVFGQAVDTEFADLLGGTTGQILSKASNTDMDFTWITNDVGDITAVNVTSPVTGGGSSGAVTIGVSAASTSASGVVQLSDSTSTTSSVLASTPTATKSAYDLAASAYAPAFTNNFYAGKNKFINGDLTINQRAFTTQTNGTGTFGFDRLKMNGIDGTTTFTPQIFTPGTAPITGYEATNYLRIVTTGQTLTTAESDVFQQIEDVRTFANQTVTISFFAKANSGTPKISAELRQNFGSGGSTTVSTPVGASTISTSWARYSLSVTVPSISGKTIGTSSNLAVVFFVSAGTSLNTRASSIGIQSNTFDIWGIQIEAGSTATPFQTASGSIGGELALCQRYYVRYDVNSGVSYGNYGAFVSTTVFDTPYNIPVEMRVKPTTLDYSNANAYDVVSGTSYNTGTFTLFGGSNKIAAVRYTHGSAVFTVGRIGYLYPSPAGYIGFSAEL